MVTMVTKRSAVERRTGSRAPGVPAGAATLGHVTDPRTQESTRLFLSAFVNLYTHDIEAGIRFYRDQLGFRETFRTPKEGAPEHVELELHGFGLGLGTVEAARRVHEIDAAPGSPAMVVVVWTADVDRAFERLSAGGAPVLQRPHDTGNDNRNALLRDPDGNLVEIVAKRRPTDGTIAG
jgi:lactoylglutathione lyase